MQQNNNNHLQSVSNIQECVVFVLVFLYVYMYVCNFVHGMYSLKYINLILSSDFFKAANFVASPAFLIIFDMIICDFIMVVN